MSVFLELKFLNNCYFFTISANRHTPSWYPGSIDHQFFFAWLGVSLTATLSTTEGHFAMQQDLSRCFETLAQPNAERLPLQFNITILLSLRKAELIASRHSSPRKLKTFLLRQSYLCILF